MHYIFRVFHIVISMNTFTSSWFPQFANSTIIFTLVNSKFNILEFVKVMQRRLQCCIMFQFVLTVTLNRVHIQMAKIQMSLSASRLDQSWLTIQTRSATANVRSESRGNAVLCILICDTWAMFTNLWIFITKYLKEYGFQYAWILVTHWFSKSKYLCRHFLFVQKDILKKKIMFRIEGIWWKFLGIQKSI